MNVAIYTRVSTEKQDYDNQLYQLREFCKKQGWVIYNEYAETISGKEAERPKFKELMDDASKHKFDTILVWALDRFTREGTAKVWYYFSLLNNWKVQFISYEEPYLRTDNELARDILISVMGALAKQERIRISERTKAGLERVRQQGKKLGRQEIPEDVRQQIIKMREQDKSFRDICKEVYYWDKSRNKHFVSMGFVHKTLLEYATKNLRK